MADYAQMSSAFEDELEWEEWKRDVPFWKHAVAGSTAGIVEHTAMYPLDTIKTRLQAYSGPGHAPRIREVVRDVTRESGVGGLFRGWNVIASGCVPAHIALFTVYETMKERLSEERVGVAGQSSSHHLSSANAALCGIVATAAHDCILTPMDVVKQRLQLGCYEGALDCTRRIFRTEGVAALFRSYPTTLLINAPYGAVLVAVNEKVKSLLVEPSKSAVLSYSHLPGYFFSAGVAAACASISTHPLDVIKTRLQTQDCFCQVPPSSCPKKLNLLPKPPLSSPKYSDFFQAFKLIYVEEGVRGFYRGLIPRAALSVPGAALCWGTYESVKSFLQ